MKRIRIITLALAALMVASSAFGCAKKDEEDKVVREVIEERVVTPDGDDDYKVQYKEEFYFYDSKTQEQYILGLTETDFRFVKVAGTEEYSADFIQATGNYTFDKDGNYVLDRYTEKVGKLFFSEYLIDDGKVNTYVKPIILKKCGNIYLSDEGDFALVKTAESDGKFLWFKGFNENRLVLNQGADKPERQEAYLIDGKTGVGTSIKLTAENFTQLDTSVIGDTTATVTYENVEYTVDVNVKDSQSWGEIIRPMKYNALNATEGLPILVAKGTSYQDYFSKYQGTEPLFSYYDGDVTEYTVDGWDTEEVEVGQKMYYRVKAEISNRIYTYVGFVYVCDSQDEIETTIEELVYDNEDVGKTNCGLWFVPKGHEISGVKGNICRLDAVLETDVELTVSEYDASKLGAQKVKLAYNGTTTEQMVYVYDETNEILSKVELVGLKWNAEGTAIDYSNASIKFMYCDGTSREASVEGYKSSISEKSEDDGSITVCFSYNVTVNEACYPFKATVLVVPQVVE